MDKSQTRIPPLDILINKSGTKIWIDTCNKQTDLKRYVPFTSNQTRHCLTNHSLLHEQYVPLLKTKM